MRVAGVNCRETNCWLFRIILRRQPYAASPIPKRRRLLAVSPALKRAASIWSLKNPNRRNQRNNLRQRLSEA